MVKFFYVLLESQKAKFQIPPLRSMMFSVNTTTRTASNLDYLQFCTSQPLLPTNCSPKIWVSFQNFEWVFKIWVSFKSNTTIFPNTTDFELNLSLILKFWSTNLGGEWCYLSKLLLEVKLSSKFQTLAFNNLDCTNKSALH